MTKEEKELLLVDLSARLRFNTIILIENDDESLPFRTDKAYTNTLDEEHWSYFRFSRIDITPYLRSMSSMTDAEKKDYQYITERWMYDSNYSIADSIDWLNAHHFDYRGLIEKELALEASDDMYNS